MEHDNTSFKSILYIARCMDYQPVQLYTYLQEGLDTIGGASSLIAPGTRVLIKPNLCLAQSPESAIITHPELVRQLIKIINECGAEAIVGDNPIGKTDKDAAEKLWSITRYSEIFKDLTAQKTLLDAEGFENYTAKIGGTDIEYMMSIEYLQADMVINVPKFKTHALMGFTGAVKNILGTVPGRSKLGLHRQAPAKMDFAHLLTNIYKRRKPELTVMDAIWGIEGDGPGAKGNKRQVGALMMSNDGVLLDAVSARVMGLDIEDIPTNRAARETNIGTFSAETMVIRGQECIEEFFISDFSVPLDGRYKSPQIIKKLYSFARFKMEVDADKCQYCMKCQENCPVECIELVQDKLCIGQDSCIQCLCCIEVCPLGAINASKNKFYEQLGQLKSNKCQPATTCPGAKVD